MKTIIFLTLTLMMSCSFNSSDEGMDTTKEQQIGSLNRFGLDRDGDLVSDQEELSKGRNPLVSDIPNLRIRFLQNYKIVAKARRLETDELEEFIIDTKVGRDDPDFKYRVGEIFIRDEAYKEGARIGRFSGHSYGEVEEHDLTWVKYPEVDPSFYLKQVMDNKKYFDRETYQIESISLFLESSVRLKENGHFKSIKNLSLNFHYYDYEKERFERLNNVVVERHFNQGVNEIFEVEISNVPLNLIEENYFKRGEFVISEIEDYEIPELETSYKTLLQSVKEKSIPVVFNNPLESSVYYVGVDGDSAKLNQILEILFDKNFEIKSDVLSKIQQFENNLPEFTYLNEVKNLNKKGKWFVFTSPINRHFLDFDFGTDDFISISYILGSELAVQSNELIYSFRDDAQSGEEGLNYPLGNILPHSEVEIQLAPKRMWGERVKQWSDVISSARGGCSGNCTSRDFACHLRFNIFESMDQDYVFDRELRGELNRVTLVINQEEFNLRELVEVKKIEAHWINHHLHLKIFDISSIKEIAEVAENVISIKITPFRETTFNGVLLENWSGRDWFFCPAIASDIAGGNKWPLSVDSREFANWQGHVNWGMVSRGERKTYTQQFSLGMSTIVKNFYN